MALWIRRRPPERCHEAEIEVAEYLADLDDGWLIRWGFTYRDNQDAPREGDFLISSPDGGLLVLEVKAGNVSLNPYTGRWSTADGDDPWFQLGAEWSSVVHQVRQFQGHRQPVYVGRALGTPHLSLDHAVQSHHGIPREHLFDRADLRHFARTWSERMRGWGARLHRTDRETLELAFGDEGSARAIRQFIDDLDRTLTRHTGAAYTLLDQLGENRQFLVTGGAGTGKTWLALELARRWASEHGLKVLLLAYNLGFTGELRGLTDRMRALRRLQQGSMTVWSWEELVQRLFAEAGLPYEPPSEAEARRDFFENQVPGLLRDVLAGGYVSPRFDALIVDEGQDHDTTTPGSGATVSDGGWWPVYFRLLHRGTQAPSAVFYDEAQRPSFRAGRFEVDALLACWQTHPVHVRLSQSLRFSRPIHEFLSSLSAPEWNPLVARLGSPPSLVHGPPVEHLVCPTSAVPEAVSTTVAKWLDQGWARPEQVLILSRRGSLDRSSLAELHQLAGHPLREVFHPERGTIGFGSVNKAKGLDRLAVVVIDFPPLDSMPPEERVPFFLGVSRARQLLAVVATESGNGST